MAADAEMCMMAADTMEALGIPRGSYVVKVNNRKVLDGVMESIGLGGEENAGKRLTVLRAIDKLDRLGIEGVRLCSAQDARTKAAISPRARDSMPSRSADVSDARCYAADRTAISIELGEIAFDRGAQPLSEHSATI